MIPGSLLLGHQLPDRRILYSLQSGSIDLPVLEIRTGLLQRGRAEKTADKIITKRRIGFAHTVLLCMKKLNLL